MNIQLTISMLVSDRSTTLKKCLDSLKELLCELSCELIVVFTGEQEETLNIVKQYTDHIIPFKWCNDFSAARNVGLREAKGEWFMYIDDDEWFEDVSEIISFFKTRECDAYESAAYVARNYQDWEAKEYIDAYIVRLYRNDGKLEFTSSIHEAINKLGVPRKFFKNYVHHYGYVSDGKKEAKKSDRNIPLLLEEIEKNSTSTKNYMQLAQEYKGTHEFDKAEECCRKGISIALHESKFYTSDMWMIAYLPIFIALQGEDEKALSEAERFLKDEEVINLSKIYLCHTAVVCCLRLKKFEKGLKYVKEFYEIWKRLRKEEEAGQRYEHADMNLLEAGKKVQQVYICGLHLAVKAKDFKSVSQILKWIPWEDETAMKSYYPELEKWKNSFPDEKKEILKYLSDISHVSFYLLLQKALYAESQCQTARLKKLVKQCQEAYSPENFEISPQIVELALRNELDMEFFLKELPFQYWEGYALQTANHAARTEWKCELEKIKNVLRNYPLHYSLFEQSFLEKQMMMGDVEGRELQEYMGKYCKIVIEYYRAFFQENCFREENYNMLPAKCIFALFVQEALENLQRNEPQKYIKNLRKALYVYPAFSRIIGKLLKNFEKIPTKTSNIEFIHLGEQVKEQVKMLISKKQYLEAYSILMKLLQMMPDDTELLRLKQSIITAEI